MKLDYQAFLESKRLKATNSGIEIKDSDINPMLYDFQKAIVKWACRKGRAAVFADCGLGKTFMQLEWARLLTKTSLIVAPLCVAKQTITEAKKMGVDVRFVRRAKEVKTGINITNYEMIEKFNSNIDAVILDESSILKNLAGKTRKKLINTFKNVPLRLCCTATPCPNDIAELGNHAEFLGYMTHAEMLASFFVNKADKGMGWVMKGYAKEAFYRWLASWSVCLNSPENLGFDGSRFVLPNINISPVIIKTNYRRPGELFFVGMKGIQDRAAIRKDTVERRIEAANELIRQSGNGSQWIAWCGLNNEANKLRVALGGKLSINVQGSDSLEKKEESIWSFINRETRVLITKPKIAGHGMNFQNCHNMLFVGLSDSYEAYYQCIRRSWRYGQKYPVNIYVILTDAETEIYENVLRKEASAKSLSMELLKNIEEFERIEIVQKEVVKMEKQIVEYRGDLWTLFEGDCVEVMSKKLTSDSVDLSVYSPPFMSLYTYSETDRDIGNSKSDKVFWEHYGYAIENLLRITKPGRNTAVHLSQVPAMLIRDGYIGLKDLRGQAVEEYQKRGWIYHGEIVIQKNPQAQAVRTKSKSLLFVQLKRDASWLRPGLADYILLFRKPGENKIPIIPKDISNEDWIKFAHPVWFDIRESNTLNKNVARTEKDEKHICPLQLDVIDRCIRLWSNPGELVFSPFAGIGSEGYQSILRKRNFLGIELKPEYVKVALNNLRLAESKTKEDNLFSLAGVKI